MSFSRDKSKDEQRAQRIFGESGEEDDDLDIIKASRKGLDLSQYIDGQSMLPLPSYANTW